MKILFCFAFFKNKKAASEFSETITKNVAQNFGNFNFPQIKEESANSLLRRHIVPVSIYVKIICGI